MYNKVYQVIDEIKKVEFVIYPPGAGGEFFCALMANADHKTRKMIRPKNSSKHYPELREAYHVALEETDRPILRYRSALYLCDPSPLTKSIEGAGKVFPDINFVQSFKEIIAATILEWNCHCGYHPLEGKFKEMMLILPQHRSMWTREMHETVDHVDNPWTSVNITPNTQLGRGVCDSAHRAFFDRVDQPDENYSVLENVGHKHFPFLDYMVEQDYDGICKWAVEQYGDGLNTDFMKRELLRYYKFRVIPLLDIYHQKVKLTGTRFKYNKKTGMFDIKDPTAADHERIRKRGLPLKQG